MCRSIALSSPRSDHPGVRETGDLSGGEAGFAQHLDIVLAHTWWLAPYAGTLPVGAELDWQGQ
jgi:hypothetical protein